MKFELEQFNRDVPDDELISDLQRAAAICGEKMTTRQYNQQGKYTSGTIARRFETWNLALIAAGVLPSEFKNISNDELIADLQRVAVVCGNKMTFRQYDLHGKFTSGTIAKRFGSWNVALNAAGVAPSEYKNIPNELLFQNLEEVWRKLGRQPKVRDLTQTISRYGASAYMDRFGSWRKALESFLEFANSDTIEPDTIEDVIEPIEMAIEGVVTHKTKRNINWRKRWHVLSRDYYKCVACGRAPAKDPSVELHVDHIKPWSKGGETVLENLQTLCATCNLGKSNIE